MFKRVWLPETSVAALAKPRGVLERVYSMPSFSVTNSIPEIHTIFNFCSILS